MPSLFLYFNHTPIFQICRNSVDPVLQTVNADGGGFTIAEDPAAEFFSNLLSDGPAAIIMRQLARLHKGDKRTDFRIQPFVASI